MIPTNYKDIKLEQLAGVHKILKSKDDHVDKCIRLLSYLTNKSRRYYESLPLWKLQHHFKQISFLFQPNPKLPVKKVIWLNGYPYKALLDVSKFSSSRYLSLKHYVSNGQTEQNLHKIIALMYKPLFKSDKLDEEGNYKDDSMNEINRRAELIKSKSCYDVYGAVFFYSKVSTILSARMQTYLEQAMEKINHHMKELNLN